MNKKVILVSGATGYFGKYFVNALAAHFHVIATSRSLDKLNAMFNNKNITNIPIDIYDESKLVDELEKICSHYDVYGLVNNAYDFSTKTGFNTSEGSYDKISLSMMRHGLESGVLAPMIFTQIIGRQMINKKIKGSIVNIASMYGTVAPDASLYEGKTTFNPVTYGVSKAAINGLTRYGASFWGQFGIRCNSISPGPFPNIETASANATQDLEFLERLKNKTALKRVGHPNDLVPILLLLLGEDSGYITGQNIGVDGGWTII